jgi:hypothetical protein
MVVEARRMTNDLPDAPMSKPSFHEVVVNRDASVACFFSQ